MERSGSAQLPIALAVTGARPRCVAFLFRDLNHFYLFPSRRGDLQNHITKMHPESGIDLRKPSTIRQYQNNAAFVAPLPATFGNPQPPLAPRGTLVYVLLFCWNMPVNGAVV